VSARLYHDVPLCAVVAALRQARVLPLAPGVRRAGLAGLTPAPTVAHRVLHRLNGTVELAYRSGAAVRSRRPGFCALAVELKDGMLPAEVFAALIPAPPAASEDAQADAAREAARGESESASGAERADQGDLFAAVSREGAA
jgi:hypothetical protein